MFNFIFSFLLLSQVYALPLQAPFKRLFFDVSSGELTKDGPNSPTLSGTLKANDVVIDFGAEKLEFEKPREEIISADVEWNELTYRLAVKKEGIKFSTPLIEGLGVTGVEYIGFKSAKVEFNKSGISMTGDKLSFKHKALEGSFTQANIFCPTNGQVTTEVDKACLTESQSAIGVISFDQNVLDADFFDAKVNIDPKSFSLLAHKARFNDPELTTEVDEFSMTCAQLPKVIQKKNETLSVDPYRLLQGCLMDGTVKIGKMDTKDKMLDVLAEVWPEFVEKEPNLKDNKDLVDLDNIRDIQLSVKEGQLSLVAKVKALFWVKIKLRGSVVLVAKSSELHFRIHRATIWGVPTKKLAYRLIEKFGNGDFIEIRGDVIVFKI